MQKLVTTKAITKVAAVAAGVAMAVTMLSSSTAYAASLSQAQIQSILSLLSSFGADSGTIANVNDALTGTASTGGTSGMTSSCTFTRSLTIGSSGADVTCLQNALISAGYSIPAGATGYFGSETQAAVAAWQQAVGVSPDAGYFGPISQAAWNLGSTSTTSTGNTGTGTVSTGTGLDVGLASDSPNGSALVTDQAIGDLGNFNFTNPTGSAITVTSLSFNRIGVSNDSSLDNVYLYDVTKTISLSGAASVSQGAFSFDNPAGLFTVPAGGSYEVDVLADIDQNAGGQQIGVQLTQVGLSSGALDSSVALPISGGFQTVANATPATVSFNSASSVIPSNATLSTGTDQLLWQDNVSISTNNVNFKTLTFTNVGSAPATSFQNLILEIDGNQVGTTQAAMNANGTVTFTLATPQTLDTGSHTISLYGDIVGGSARTFSFEIYQSSDAQFIDSELGVPVRVEVDDSSFTPLGALDSNTIAGVSSTSGVSVSKDPSSPSTNVPANVSHQLLGTFDFQTNGEAVKVTDLYAYANLTGDDANGSPLTTSSGLTNGEVYLNGVQVGPTHTLSSNSASPTDFSMGSSMIIPANVVTPVQIYADTIDGSNVGLGNGATVEVVLSNGTNNGQGQSSLQVTDVPSSPVSANDLTVSSSSLSASSYSGYGSQTIIPGTTNARLGSFTLSAGSTEGVNVNTITIAFAEGEAASVTNLTLKNDATGAQIGSVITTPSSSNNFSGSLTIPVSSSETVDIYGNVLSNAGVGTLETDVAASGNGASSGSAVSTGPAVDLQYITLGSGSLSVTQGAGDLISTNGIAGSTQVPVGQFTFTGSNSTYTIQSLGILVPNADASAISSLQLQYTNSAGTQVTSPTEPVVSSGSGDATATFSGLSAYVPNNSTGNVEVLANLAPISSSNVSGNSINVGVDYGGDGATDNTFRAVDSSGNLETSVGAGNVFSGGTLYTRLTVPTYAMLTPSGYNDNSPTNPLYEFSITAPTAGPVDWSKIAFNISASVASASSTYLVNMTNGTDLLDTGVYGTLSGNTLTFNLATQNSVQPKHQQVAAGSTATYGLYGTVNNWSTGASLSIGLIPDTSHVSNGTATTTSGDVIWSDESAPDDLGIPHAITSMDWTNGYLLQNFSDITTTYTY